MLSRSGRPLAQAIFGPIARLCVRAGISADAVTITGTVAVVACALVLYPLGHPVWASWLIGITVIFDSLDGQIARLTGTASRWGAFLDSTLDRLADSAIFCGILLWITRWNIGAGAGLTDWLALACLAALPAALCTSYARARAEAVGFTANVGISERADRLVIVLLGALITGYGASAWVLLVALGYLAVAGWITVAQRMVTVYRQSRAEYGAGERAAGERAGQGSGQ
ncbi:phosphatidylinositol phosphate synthase [Actinotignum sanguinis]|uniref:Phosphatidylinositol phosphate synthase n=3 Tax=Actinomycetaceae TaxID=2049 RepID=A0ABZ0RCD2_9ACTO|nr:MULTISPECIES: CDP-alcohol phosphatidyltransferase family protein [Actinotignum]WPJ89544.1 CDP-alcohol phosphatidyltransferase family protein [Schaalia turicensis]MDE1655922.1 CDP-alcohol phosphatidyltransferase family protein [Actinotignum sanguinis]MDK6927503.1 CDP-alcohol phosphatidyltransferase family protein [Actinotignum timonense]MDK8287352.1 CDP-alcohol phosphatidyltransferase family protein [Actinotignum sanguinis]MDK8353085.1 CDP-alcohol phosphatidyltransferase family protein [Acti